MTDRRTSKGKQIYVEGLLGSCTYQTQSGETRHNDINVNEIQFLGQRDGGGQGPAPGNNEGSARDDLDDLPF